MGEDPLDKSFTMSTQTCPRGHECNDWNCGYHHPINLPYGRTGNHESTSRFLQRFQNQDSSTLPLNGQSSQSAAHDNQLPPVEDEDLIVSFQSAAQDDIQPSDTVTNQPVAVSTTEDSCIQRPSVNVNNQPPAVSRIVRPAINQHHHNHTMQLSGYPSHESSWIYQFGEGNSNVQQRTSFPPSNYQLQRHVTVNDQPPAVSRIQRPHHNYTMQLTSCPSPESSWIYQFGEGNSSVQQRTSFPPSNYQLQRHVTVNDQPPAVSRIQRPHHNHTMQLTGCPSPESSWIYQSGEGSSTYHQQMPLSVPYDHVHLYQYGEGSSTVQQRPSFPHQRLYYHQQILPAEDPDDLFMMLEYKITL